MGIHAHPVDGAPTLEESLLPVTLAGELGSGKPWQAEVFIPHPYSFLMMKLFVFRDRLNDADKEFGRYHALDLYMILATMMKRSGELVSKYEIDTETSLLFWRRGTWSPNISPPLTVWEWSDCGKALTIGPNYSLPNSCWLLGNFFQQGSPRMQIRTER